MFGSAVSQTGCRPEQGSNAEQVSLQVLILGDSDQDALLLLNILHTSGLRSAWRRVDSADTLRCALATQTWELVLADYPLANFTGEAAIQLIQDSGQDVPFIIVSGIHGEDLAVSLIKAGAHDYLLKDQLDRLVPSIQRELRAAAERRIRKQDLATLKDREHLEEFVASGSAWFWELGPDLRFTYISHHFEDITGVGRDSIIGRLHCEIPGIDAGGELWTRHREELAAKRPFKDFQYSIRRPDRDTLYLTTGGVPVFAADGAFRGYRGTGVNVTVQVLAEAQVTRTLARLEDTVESIAAGCALYDADDRLVFCNQAYRDALAGNVDSMVPGMPFGEVIRAFAKSGKIMGTAGCEEAWISQRLALHRQFEGPIEHQCRDGRWVQVNEYRTREGETLIVRTDITELKRIEESLRKLSQAIEQSPVSVIITDIHGNIEYVNPKFVEVTGYTMDEVIGCNPRILKSGQQHPAEYHELWQTITNGKEWRGEFLNRRKNGDTYWEYASITAIKNLAGEITHFLAVKEDITLRKEYEARLVYQAKFDQLTKLPNRNQAMHRLSSAVARARRLHCKAGLLLINLDRFKQANDSLGHATGDRLLQQAGERCRNCVREEDTVARMGNDEYAIVLVDLRSALYAETVAAKILDAFSKPFLFDDHEVFVTASIGITMFPDNGDNAEALMRGADSAMHWVKEKGRNHFRFFTPDLNQKALTLVRLESQLRHALERGELTLHYQPIVDIRSGALIGAEALLRWYNAEFGQVSPDRFIGLAEDTGLIIPIGSWALQTACRQLRAWRKQTAKRLRMAVNVSSRQFRGKTLLQAVSQALTENELSPYSLELEITESLLIDELPETETTLQDLEAMGVALSVDDFGTGYSALSYLKRFRVDTLKIDQSFIRDITTSPDDVTLVKAVIAMGRSLDLTLVAEGVETADELALLWVYGCDQVQGHYFSPALPAAEFSDLLQHWESAPKPRGRWG